MGLEKRIPILETFHQTDSNIKDIITTGATHPELEILDFKETGTKPKDYNKQNREFFEISDNSSYSEIQTDNVSDTIVPDAFPAVSLEKEYSSNATCYSDLCGIHSFDMELEKDCDQSNSYQDLPAIRKEYCAQYYESLGEPFSSLELTTNIPNSGEPSIEEICSFEYIKNLIIEGPKLSDVAASDIYGQLNIMPIDEELDTQEGSPEYDKYIASLEDLDQQLYTKIEQALVTASLEFKVRDRLSEIDDPTGDDLTDVNVRAERYTAEFLERFEKFKSEQAGSDDI